MGRDGLTHVPRRPPCQLMARWVIRPVGSILVVERKTDLRPWEQGVGGGGWGPRAQGGGRTRRLRTGPALAPGTSASRDQAGAGPGLRRPRPGSQGTWMVLLAKTLGLSPGILGGSGNRAAQFAAWSAPGAGRRDGRGRVSRPRDGASPVLLALDGPRASLLWGGERPPARRRFPRGNLGGPGWWAARMAGLHGRLPLGQRGRGVTTGTPGPLLGGLEPSTFLQTENSLYSSAQNPHTGQLGQQASLSAVEAGRPGPAVSQEASLLGSGTAVSSLCPHAAGRVFLGVSFCSEERQAC